MRQRMHYVIENPATAYGMAFLRCLHRRFGARALCVHTDDSGLATDWRRRFPELLDRRLVDSHVRVSPGDLPAFVERLRQRYRVQAVIPHNELVLSSAITIAEGLGLEWVQPTVMRRFRDKHALKSHLRRVDPGLRVNLAVLVGSPREAHAEVARNGLSRFVLKPNDGCGNVNIGIFSTDDPPAMVEEYWTRTRAGTVLLEEYIAGREYHCNGQVDAKGTITIVDIGRTHNVMTERREMVYRRADLLRSTDPVFVQIADYVGRVIRASGLRRSPFHAEVRVDERGPCLVECAARLIGSEWALHVGPVHGPRLDLVDLAAHYYVTSEDYGDVGVDWAEHDRAILVEIRGVAERVERIETLEGVEEVERLPQFVAWTDKPTVGRRLEPTHDLLSSAFVVVLRCRDSNEADALEHEVRSRLRWNRRPVSASARLMRRVRAIPGHLAWRIGLHRRLNERRLDRTLRGGAQA